MIGISRIASFIPAGTVSNRARLDEFDIDEEFLRDKIGAFELARLSPGMDTSDLCVGAWDRLLTGTGPLADIDCLVVCTQNPDGHGIPHASAIVHAKLGLGESCAAFDLGLGCSGYVYGLSVVQSFMAANGMKKGLLFTADPYSKIVDPADKNTALLFGDAATVTLLAVDAPWVPGKYRFATRGLDGKALNNDSGRLFMNGRAVFSFSATAVPQQVTALLQENGLSPDDIDRFFFHQGSKYIVDTLGQRLRIPEEKIARGVGRCGNTVSSSIPLMLEDALEAVGPRRFLLSGFGVGLSWASCLLERQ